MYSSPLTGLNIQYDRRTCEDDGNWVSTLDNSVRCSTLSPTDEKCHHYDVNGNSGYDSCPKACGNCFEEGPSASEDSGESMESQPMGLYSGETGETNEFDPLGSSSRGRGDLEDLVYKFTYEINDKINDLSEKIDDYKDKTESRIEINEESNRGVCYKKVCIPKVRTDFTDQTIPDTCNNVDCNIKRYSECGLEGCCKLLQDNVSPDYYMASEEEKTRSACNNEEENFYIDVSRDVADDDIQLFQQRLIRGASLSGDPNQPGNPNEQNSDNDFSITIKRSNNSTINLGKDIKKGNITYIPLRLSASAAENKIKDFRIDGTQEFLSGKYVYFAKFNKLETESLLNSDDEIWTQYHFSDAKTTADNKTYDYLVIKLTSAYVQNTDMCSNDDSKHNNNNCDIFSDKDASYYIYLFAQSKPDEALTGEIDYGSFYYAVKESTDPKKINFTSVETKGSFFAENIVGLYFQYNAENLIFQKTGGVTNKDPYIKSRSLHIDIEYPLEDGDSDMEKKSISINDIFSQNELMSAKPLLYKIHDFDKDDENINLSKIDIKIDTNHFFVKDHNPKCDSNTITITWWISVAFIGLLMLGVYGSYTTLKDYKSTDNIVIAMLTLITLFLIFVIRVFGKQWRAYLKSLIYIIAFVVSIAVYSNVGGDMKIKSITGMNILQLLSLVYLINITTYTDYSNKFINPEKGDCDLSMVYPILYSVITFVMILMIIISEDIFVYFNDFWWARKIIFTLIAIIAHYFANKDDDNKMVKHIYEWFGYDNNSSGWGSLLRLYRDILILI